MPKSRLSKTKKADILRKATGIPEYGELAKIAKQSRHPLRAENSAGRKTKTPLTKEQIAELKAEASRKQGVILGSRANRESKRLNIVERMVDAATQINSQQPVQQRRGLCWRLFYDYLLPSIQSDVHERPLLRKKLNERRIIQRALEKFLLEKPIFAEEIKLVLENERKHLWRIKKRLKEEERNAHQRNSPAEITPIHRELSRLDRKLVATLHALNLLKVPNPHIPAVYEIENLRILNQKVFEDALKEQAFTLEPLIGSKQTETMQLVEEIARRWIHQNVN